MHSFILISPSIRCNWNAFRKYAWNWHVQSKLASNPCWDTWLPNSCTSTIRSDIRCRNSSSNVSQCVWMSGNVTGIVSENGTSCQMGSCIKSLRWTNCKTCKWRINFRSHSGFLEKRWSQRSHVACCFVFGILYSLRECFVFCIFLKLTLCRICPYLAEFLASNAVCLEPCLSIHSVRCQMTNWILQFYSLRV